MKKILALSLALLMMAASLAACNKKNNNVLSDDEDEGYVSTTQKPSDTTTPDDKDPEDPTTQTGTWVERNDETVYVGMDGVNLRTGPATSYSSAFKVNAGQQLTRKATNGAWDKVVYNDQEYYIASDLVTANGKDFNITAKDPAGDLTIKDGVTIILRVTPFDPMKGSAYYEANIALYGVSAKDGGTLKKIGVSESGDWYQVSYVGTFNGKTYNGTEKLYMHKNNVLNGYVVDPDVTVSNPGSNPGIG